MSGRDQIPKSIQREIFIEAGFRCAQCRSLYFLELHHILPYRINSEHNKENLIVLCKECHKKTFRQEEKLLKIFSNIKRVTSQEFSISRYFESYNLENLIKLSHQGFYDKEFMQRFHQELSECKKDNDHIKGILVLTKARMFKHRGQPDRSITLTKGALNYFRNDNNLYQIATCLYLLGGNYFIKENFQMALNYYIQSERIALSLGKDSNVKDLIIDVLRDIGITYATIGNWRKGLEYNQKSIRLSEADCNARYVLALQDRAKILTNYLKFDKAYKLFDQCEKMMPKSEFLGRIMLFNFFGNFYWKTGEIQRAQELFDFGKKFAKLFGYKYELYTAIRKKRSRD
jgi:tetratricopeptide (TPR) repeat protein